MNKLAPIFYAKIEHGKLRFTKTLDFHFYIQKLEGKEVKVLVAERKYIRSVKANSYYWGCVLKVCSDYTGFTPEECHQVFKERFLKYTKDHKGKNFEFTHSTSELDTKEFSDYIQKIKLYMAEEHQVAIPEAGEYGEI